MSEKLYYIECSDCKFKHPAGVQCCPQCGSFNFETKVSSGNGFIYTFTVPAKALTGHHKHRYPFAVAVVETSEGVRLSTIVEGIQENNVKIGDKVRLKAIEEETGPIFVAA